MLPCAGVRIVVLAFTTIALLDVLPRAARAAVPTNFLDQLVVGNLSQPVGFAFLPDSRIIVIEQTTKNVRLVARRPGGDVLSGPILNIAEASTVGSPERGLLGVAVDPAWPARPYVYFHFTTALDAIFIRMYTASGDLTDPRSLNLTLGSPYTILNDVPDEGYAHNGGGVRFGRDGKLLVSLGDDEHTCDAQDRNELRAGIIRLDVSALPQPGSGPPPKSLITPTDNPWVADADPEAKLLAHYGLRNPFRFTVDPVTGNLFIGDVGDNNWEELDEAATLGMNFGWPVREGAHAYPSGCPGTSGTDPVWEYNRTGGSGSIMAGPRYRPAPGLPPFQFPGVYLGDVFVVEYFQGWMRRIKRSPAGTWSIAPAVPGQPSPSDWATGMNFVSDILEGPDGGIYYVQQFSAGGSGPGQIRRIIYTATVTDVDPGISPAAVSLAIAPNPVWSAGATTIDYSLARDARVTVGIHDVTGARVATVFEGFQVAGHHHVLWDGLSDAGIKAPSGIYFVRLESEREPAISRKLAVVR